VAAAPGSGAVPGDSDPVLHRTGWIEPLADRVRLDIARLRRTQRRLDRQHRGGSPGCFPDDGTHKPGHCGWQRSMAAKRTTTRVAEQHRGLAEHRKTLHGALANRLFAHGADMACEKLDYVAWQKNFPRSVRDRAPGLLVEMLRRKAESAGGDRLYEYNPNTTALSQTCLCGNRKKKPLSQRVHRCACGIKEDRTCSPRTLGSTSTGTRRVSTGWIWRQPIMAGCSTVRTSMVAEVQPQHHPTGEAADIRRRGGQWRASKPAGPRGDRAGRRELPPPTGPRR
jgi:putative transposase